MERGSLIHPFEPVVFKDTEVLILGSFPSIHSFEKNFYYAHSRNQFWKILSTITGYPALTRDQRMWLLKETKLGLWDMIHSCSRENSLDSTLEEEEVHDIPTFLERHPSIKSIAFTGRKAQALFETHFDYLEIERVYLPSPSAAYAKISFEAKVALYREKLSNLSIIKRIGLQ